MMAFRQIAQSLWVGGLLFVFGVVGWTMWRNPLVGRVVAAHLFPSIACVGMVIGSLLIVGSFVQHGLNVFRTSSFWVTLLMALLALVSWIGIRQSFQWFGWAPHFASWHRLQVFLYLSQCILGVLLISRTA